MYFNETLSELFRQTGRRKLVMRFNGHEGGTAVHRGMHRACRNTKKTWPSTAAQEFTNRNVSWCHWISTFAAERAGLLQRDSFPPIPPSRAGFVELFVSILLLPPSYSLMAKSSLCSMPYAFHGALLSHLHGRWTSSQVSSARSAGTVFACWDERVPNSLRVSLKYMGFEHVLASWIIILYMVPKSEYVTGCPWYGP